MIKEKLCKYPFFSCTVLFIICIIARIFEYFFLRIDETIIAENFIHKAVGIILLLFMIHILQLKWRNIGFKQTNIIRNLGLGLLLALICFTIAYCVELSVLNLHNLNPNLEIYASGFSMTGNAIKQTGIGFILLCIVFNTVNVWMEEGIFRGLFIYILKSKYSFWIVNIMTAFLFGIWHWVMPMRSYIDGDLSLSNFLFMGLGYIFLAGIMSIKWGVLYKMTGSLWAGIGDHLFNNVIATNLLHVVSYSGIDELQIIRIMLAQLISFIFIIVVYKYKFKR